MRQIAILSLLMAAASQAHVVTVGPGKQFATVGAAVSASLPLREDLYVLVAAPTGTWTTADAVTPNANWAGYKVIVRGYTSIPTATVYVEDEAVYEHNGIEMQEAYVNVKGLHGVEGRATNSSSAYYAKDHLGSTRFVLDATSRQRLEVNAYNSYGQLRPVQVSSVPARQKFTGKELDGEMGLYYFGARYYDPELGMWISPDAVRQHHSLYTYASNNSVNRVDPDGNADVVAGGQLAGITPFGGIEVSAGVYAAGGRTTLPDLGAYLYFGWTNPMKSDQGGLNVGGTLYGGYYPKGGKETIQGYGRSLSGSLGLASVTGVQNSDGEMIGGTVGVSRGTPGISITEGKTFAVGVSNIFNKVASFFQGFEQGIGAYAGGVDDDGR